MSLASAAPAMPGILIALVALIAPIGAAQAAHPHAAAAPAPMLAPGPRTGCWWSHRIPMMRACAARGILQRARANGAATAVVWITAGDGFEFDAMLVEHSALAAAADLRQLGAQRLAEASAAAAELGVPPAQRYFLGYPDRGVTALMSDFYQRATDRPIPAWTQWTTRRH